MTPPEKQDPSVKFKEAEADAKRKDEWGAGDAGYAAPREPSDRLRCVLFIYKPLLLTRHLQKELAIQGNVVGILYLVLRSR